MPPASSCNGALTFASVNYGRDTRLEGDCVPSRFRRNFTTFRAPWPVFSQVWIEENRGLNPSIADIKIKQATKLPWGTLYVALVYIRK